jgi:hypothetical protein
MSGPRSFRAARQVLASAIVLALSIGSAQAARVHENLNLLLQQSASAKTGAKSAREAAKSIIGSPIVPGLEHGSAPEHAQNASALGSDGRVQVVAVAAGASSTAVSDLRALGATDVSIAGNLINARLPASAIAAIGSLTSITDIGADNPLVRTTNIGSVDSQGEAVMGADLARAAVENDGRGVKVCVVSDSFDTARLRLTPPRTTAADDVLRGDLPGAGNPNGFTTPVDVVLEGPNAASDEGRAMLQIVHDVAHGAELGFGSAFIGGKATTMQMLESLVGAGCKVVADDTNSFGSPFLRDGIVARKIEELVGRGVHYYIAAGNQGVSGYGNRVNAGAVRTLRGINGNVLGDYELINFNPDPNGTPDFFQEFTSAGAAHPFFQWNDRFLSEGEAGGAATDIDLFIAASEGGFDRIAFASVFRASGSPLVSLSGSYRGRAAIFASVLGGTNTGSDPLELFQTRVFSADGTQLLDSFAGLPNFGSVRFYLVAGRRVGSGGAMPTHVRWVDRNVAARNIQYGTPANTSTLVAHVQAAGAVTIAASRYDSPLVVRNFSSRGQTPLWFDPAGNLLVQPIVRRKPELTGPDGVDTTFFSEGIDYENNGNWNFPGTSAAAPHVAGVAAILLSATRKLPTPDTVRAFLQSTSIDLDDPDTAGFDSGFDARSGSGFVRADGAALAVTTDQSAVRYAVPAGSLIGNGRPLLLNAGALIARVSISGYGSGTLTTRNELAQYVHDPAPISLASFLPDRTVFVSANGRSTDGSASAFSTQNLIVTNLGFIAPKAGDALRANTAFAIEVASNENVTRVDYNVGTTAIGSSTDAGTNFRVSATLPAGTHTIVGQGRNAAGAVIHSRNITVNVQP